MDLLGIDRLNVITENGGGLAEGRRGRGTEFSAGSFAPLNSLGREVWEEVFYFALTFPPLFTSTRIYGGLGGGVGCVCVSDWSKRPSY